MSLSAWRMLSFCLAVTLLFFCFLMEGAFQRDHKVTHARGFAGCDAGWKACRLALDPSKPATDDEDATDDPGPCGLGWNACFDANAEGK